MGVVFLQESRSRLEAYEVDLDAFAKNPAHVPESLLPGLEDIPEAIRPDFLTLNKLSHHAEIERQRITKLQAEIERHEAKLAAMEATEPHEKESQT